MHCQLCLLCAALVCIVACARKHTKGDFSELDASAPVGQLRELPVQASAAAAKSTSTSRVHGFIIAALPHPLQIHNPLS